MEISIKIIILVLIFSLKSYSEENNDEPREFNNRTGFLFEFQIGILTHNLENIESFRKSTINRVTVPVKVTDDFPNKLNLKGNISYKIFRSEFGLTYSYYSTGSRATYADYSGEYKYDEVIVYQEIGGDFKYLFNRFIPLIDFQFTSALGLSKCESNSNEMFNIQKNKSIIKYSESQNDIYFEPGLKALYEFNNFQTSLNLSYMIVVSNNYYAKFKGIRAGIGFGYIL